MFDMLIEEAFLLIWVLIFYGVIYAFYKLMQKVSVDSKGESGFVIVQLLFIIVWRLLPYYGIVYLGYLPYKEIPLFWIIASMIFLLLTK